MTAVSQAPRRTRRCAEHFAAHCIFTPPGAGRDHYQPIFQTGNQGSHPSASHHEPAMEEEAGSCQHQEQDNDHGHSANHRHVGRSFHGCWGDQLMTRKPPPPIHTPCCTHVRDPKHMLGIFTCDGHNTLYSHFTGGQSEAGPRECSRHSQVWDSSCDAGFDLGPPMPELRSSLLL